MLRTKISPKIISISFSFLALLFFPVFYIFSWTEQPSPPSGVNALVATMLKERYVMGRNLFYLLLPLLKTGTNLIDNFLPYEINRDGFRLPIISFIPEWTVWADINGEDFPIISCFQKLEERCLFFEKDTLIIRLTAG